MSAHNFKSFLTVLGVSGFADGECATNFGQFTSERADSIWRLIIPSRFYPFFMGIDTGHVESAILEINYGAILCVPIPVKIE